MYLPTQALCNIRRPASVRQVVPQLPSQEPLFSPCQRQSHRSSTLTWAGRGSIRPPVQHDSRSRPGQAQWKPRLHETGPGAVASLDEWPLLAERLSALEPHTASATLLELAGRVGYLAKQQGRSRDVGRASLEHMRTVAVCLSVRLAEVFEAAGGSAGGMDAPGGQVGPGGSQPAIELSLEQLSGACWALAQLKAHAGGALAPGSRTAHAAEAAAVHALRASITTMHAAASASNSSSSRSSGSNRSSARSPPTDSIGGVNPKHLSQIAWSFATLGWGSSAFWAASGDACVAANVDTFPPQGLSNVLWAHATAEGQGQGRGRHAALLSAAEGCIAQSRRSRFNPQGVSNIAWALAKLGSRHRGAFDALSRLVLAQTSSQGGGEVYTPQHVANIAWALVESEQACADGGADDDDRAVADAPGGDGGEGAAAAALMPELARMALRSVHAFPLRSLVMVVWAVGTVGGRASASAAAGRSARSGTGSVSSSSSGEWEEQGGGDAAALQQRRSSGSRASSSGNNNNSSSSVSSKRGGPQVPPAAQQGLWEGSPHLALCVAACERVSLAPAGVGALSGQDLAMLLTGCLRARHYPRDLVRAARSWLTGGDGNGDGSSGASRLDPTSLVSISYALAKFRYYNEALYEALAAAAVAAMEAPPQHEQRREQQRGGALRTQTQARAKAKQRAGTGTGTGTGGGALSPQAATTMAWALAEVKHYSPELMTALSKYIQPQLASCTPHDLACLAAAFSEFSHQDPPLFTQLSSAVQARLDEPGAGGLTQRHAINVAWAFALQGHLDERLFERLLGHIQGLGLDWHKMGLAGTMQLFQTQIMLHDVYGGIVSAPGALPAEQLRGFSAVWRAATRATSASPLHDDVGRVLRRLGCELQDERITLDGLFSIDCSLEWAGRRVAVEVDGPWHWTFSRPHRPLGSTLAKWRCLEARGWRVLSVPGHQWAQLEGDAAKQEWLKAALDGTLWRTHLLGDMTHA